VAADLWNLTAGAMIEQAKFGAKMGVSMSGGFPIVVANEASNFFTGQSLWEHL